MVRILGHGNHSNQCCLSHDKRALPHVNIEGHVSGQFVYACGLDPGFPQEHFNLFMRVPIKSE